MLNSLEWRAHLQLLLSPLQEEREGKTENSCEPVFLPRVLLCVQVGKYGKYRWVPFNPNMDSIVGIPSNLEKSWRKFPVSPVLIFMLKEQERCSAARRGLKINKGACQLECVLGAGEAGHNNDQKPPQQ